MLPGRTMAASAPSSRVAMRSGMVEAGTSSVRWELGDDRSGNTAGAVTPTTFPPAFAAPDDDRLHHPGVSTGDHGAARLGQGLA